MRSEQTIHCAVVQHLAARAHTAEEVIMTRDRATPSAFTKPMRDRDQGATLPQAPKPEPLIVWTPTPWPDDRTVLGFSVHDLNRVPPILERMRART